MWIADDRLKTLREPRPDAAAVERLLTDARAARTHAREMPDACPLCQQPLVVRTEAHLAIRMCPSEHGAWLSAEDVARMRATADHAVRAETRRRVAGALLALAAMALLLVRHRTEEILTRYLVG